MRFLIICTMAAMAVLAFDARTQAQAAWCAIYRTGAGNCGFATHAQCLATLAGMGGTCNESPDSAPATKKSERVRRERAARKQEVVSETPSSGINLSIGFGVGGGGRHHGKGGPKQPTSTPVTPGLPPGVQ